MQEAIKNKLPIRIDLRPNRDEVHSGICLKMTKEIFVLVCYNNELKEYDGYAILRSYEIERFKYWEKWELAEIKNDNFGAFDDILPLNKMNTLHDCLLALKSNKLISVYTEDFEDSYFVGRIVDVTASTVELQLISDEIEWIDNEVINIDKITYIGFDSAYEKDFIKTLYK